MTKPKEQASMQRQSNVLRTDSSDLTIWEISKASTWDRPPTWDRLTLSKYGVVYRWQGYEPTFDETYVKQETFPANEFLSGRGKDLVILTFGEFVWREVCDEIKKQNPGLKPEGSIGSTTSALWYPALPFLLLASFSLWCIYWPTQRLLHQYRLSADSAISKHAASVVESEFASIRRRGRYSSYLEYRWVVKAAVTDGDQSHLLTVSTRANFSEAESNRYPTGSKIELLRDETSMPQVWALERHDLVSHWIWNAVDIIFIAFGVVILIIPIWAICASR